MSWAAVRIWRAAERVLSPWAWTPARANNDRRWTYRTLPAMDEGAVGETTIDLDQAIQGSEVSIFPDQTSNFRLFNGVPYNQLHICSIKVSKNNSILSIAKATGNTVVLRSCGMEGFKNTKKGTNIAAQATAISLGTKALSLGIKDIRVTVGGLGPGRMSAIKGLQMSGMNIVSITDNTKVSWNPPRPRKARRI